VTSSMYFYAVLLKLVLFLLKFASNILTTTIWYIRKID